MSEWVNESMNHWTKKWMNWVSPRVSQCMNDWMDWTVMEWNGTEWNGRALMECNATQRNATQWNGMNGMEWKGWISESMNQRITEWTNEWMDGWMERWMDGWMDLLLHRATSLLRYLLNTPWMAPFLSVNPPDEKPMLSGGCLIFNISGGWDLCCWHTLFSGKNLRLEFFLMQDSDHFQDEKSRQLC